MANPVFYSDEEWARFAEERLSNERHITVDNNSDSWAPFDQKGGSGTGWNVMGWPDGVCDITSKTIQLAKTGSTISFAEAGPADADLALLYIHGWGESWRVWQRTLLAQRKIGPFKKRIIAVDLRDFGNSKSGDRLQGRNTVGHMTDDLIALLDELNLERVAVVTHSLGSILGLQLALEHPARVASLLLVSGESTFSGNEIIADWNSALLALSEEGSMARAANQPVTSDYVEAWMKCRFAEGFQPPGWCSEMLQHDLRRVCRSVLIKSLQSLMEHDVDSELCLISCPTTIVRGELDGVSSSKDQRHLLDAIPHALLTKVPYAANFIPIEQPERLARILQNYAMVQEEHFVVGDGFKITQQGHLQKIAELCNLDGDCFLGNADYNHPQFKVALENQVNSQHSSL